MHEFPSSWNQSQSWAGRPPIQFACADRDVHQAGHVCPAGLPRKLRLCVGGEPPAMAFGGGTPPGDNVGGSQNLAPPLATMWGVLKTYGNFKNRPLYAIAFCVCAHTFLPMPVVV